MLLSQLDLGRRYGLAPSKARAAGRGLSSCNATFTSGGRRYVLREYRGSSAADVRRAETVAELLHQRGLPVVPALATSDGERHFIHAGRFFAVHPYVGGEVLHEGDLDAPALESAARVLSELHDLGIRTLPGPSLPRSSPPAPRESAARQRELLQEASGSGLDAPLRGAVVALLELKLELAGRLEPGAGDPLPAEILIHGDFHNENLLFDAERGIAAVLDLEAARIGHPLEDVLTFVHLACLNSGFGPERVAQAKRFLDAYRARRPLAEEALRRGFADYVAGLRSEVFFETRALETGDPSLLPFLERDRRRLRDLARNPAELIDRLVRSPTERRG